MKIFSIMLKWFNVLFIMYLNYSSHIYHSIEATSIVCNIPLLARALGLLAARPSARYDRASCIQHMYILSLPVFSLKINNCGHLFVKFSLSERSKLPIVMNALHRINKVLLIFYYTCLDYKCHLSWRCLKSTYLGIISVDDACKSDLLFSLFMMM